MKTKLAASLHALALSCLAACGGGAASAAGTYTVDKAQLKQAMMAAMPAEAKSNPEAASAMDEVLKGMDVTINLKADGTAEFHMKMSMMGEQMDNSEKGTWKLDGGKLTITTKNDKSGKEETKTVDYANGSFAVEEDMGGQKMKMTFKKK